MELARIPSARGKSAACVLGDLLDVFRRRMRSRILKQADRSHSRMPSTRTLQFSRRRSRQVFRPLILNPQNRELAADAVPRYSRAPIQTPSACGGSGHKARGGSSTEYFCAAALFPQRFGIPGGTALERRHLGGTAHGHLGGTAHETGVSLGTGRQRQAQLVVRWSNGNSANPTVIPSHQ